MRGCRPGLRKRLALDLFSDLYRERVREHRLDTLFWECTLRCNLSCRHCGSDCRTDPGVADMPLEDFLRVLDEEVTPHVDPAQVLVIISGGEALVRPDLERAGAEISPPRLSVGYGYQRHGADAGAFRALLDAGIRSLSVSLDGFEAEHTFCPQRSRSYERALGAVRMAVREPSLAFDVVTCVTAPLIPRLEAFRDLLIAEGVRHWRLFTIFPAGRAKNDPGSASRTTSSARCSNSSAARAAKGASTPAMPARDSSAATRPRCATTSTSVPREYR